MSLICQVCGREHPSTAPSLEFCLLLCDPCHSRALTEKRAVREPEHPYTHGRLIAYAARRPS